MRLGESVVVETVMAIGMQMAHEVVFQVGDDCGDGLDENNEQQPEEWFVHGVSLVVNVAGGVPFYCSCTKAYMEN